jgi:hypothetical protein
MFSFEDYEKRMKNPTYRKKIRKRARRVAKKSGYKLVGGY